MIATVSFSNPVVIALMIGWIMSVVLHELAHGIVAHFGGDYTIRDRGGLTVNPFQYLDPVNSVVLPLVFLLMGGVPLPGGVTYVRTDLLRTRAWRTAVSLAGPASNFLIFVLLAVPLSPKFGWVRPPNDLVSWTPSELFLATMATLQFIAACINMIPVPGVDGFNAILPYLDAQTQIKVSNPAVRQAGMFILFGLLMVVPAIFRFIFDAEISVLSAIGFPVDSADTFVFAYNHVFWGS